MADSAASVICATTLSSEEARLTKVSVPSTSSSNKHLRNWRFPTTLSVSTFAFSNRTRKPGSNDLDIGGAGGGMVPARDGYSRGKEEGKRKSHVLDPKWRTCDVRRRQSPATFWQRQQGKCRHRPPHILRRVDDVHVVTFFNV